MTNITIKEIKITSNQLWVNLNGINECLESYEVSRLMSQLKEKTIKVVSRKYHKHNDYKGFRNNFMFRLDQLLNNANHNRIYFESHKDNIFTVPYWQIDQIDKYEDKIEVTLKNLLNESIEDN